MQYEEGAIREGGVLAVEVGERAGYISVSVRRGLHVDTGKQGQRALYQHEEGEGYQDLAQSC